MASFQASEVILTLIIYVTFLCVIIASTSAAQTKGGKVDNTGCFSKLRTSGIKTYYINLDNNIERKSYTEHMLSSTGLPFKRVAAIHPNSSEYNLAMLEQPCKRNTPRDISVILSHLKAIYTAVHDPIKLSGKNRSLMDDYALIIEDDVKLLYDIDFRALIEMAPRKFGILQLVTTNPEAVDSLWYNFNTAHCDVNSTIYNITNSATTPYRYPQSACANFPAIVKNYKPKPKPKKKSTQWGEQDDYIAPEKEFELTPARVHDLAAQRLWTARQWSDFSRNGRSSLYWSSQAYIINRRVAWKFLADIVEINKIPAGFYKDPKEVVFNASSTDNKMGFKIVNSFIGHTCQRRHERPCILGSCLFSYSYIFSAAQPAHVAQIPLFTGAKIGLDSTLHSDQFADYKKAFTKIKAISSEMKGGMGALLPEYIVPLKSKCK